jgi:hypothetical protein
MFSVNSFINNRDDKFFKYFNNSNKNFYSFVRSHGYEVIRKDRCSDLLISTTSFSQNSVSKLISNLCMLHEFDLTCRLIYKQRICDEGIQLRTCHIVARYGERQFHCLRVAQTQVI